MNLAMERKGFTHQLLMVRPAHFGFNVETSLSNEFQTKPTIAESAIAQTARQEFDAFLEEIRNHDIDVEVWEEDGEKVKPDAVFPNNWVSFHQDGTIVTYPMYAENRRWERSAELVEHIAEKFGFTQFIGFEDVEQDNKFLEGTGSMVLDREAKICYACLSQRTSKDLLDKWCSLMEYDKVSFTATDQDGRPIYHTNVMMSIGPGVAVICIDSIQDQEERREVMQTIEQTGKAILEISFEQMNDFAGNMLFVTNRFGAPHVMVSERAWNSLSDLQKNKLSMEAKVVLGKIRTIETVGGGSVRCMLAEIFPPS